MTKLFLLLKSFSKKEMTAFVLFLENPLVNRRDDLRQLLTYRLSNPIKFTKEKAYSDIYPGQSFNANTWHLLTSRLFKLAEQFLITNELKKEEVYQKSLLAKAYRKKQIASHFESTIQDTRKILSKKTVQNADWVHQKFTIEYEYFDYIASHNRKEKTNLQVVNDLLDEYYITNKLKNACLAVTRKTINNEDYNIRFISFLLLQLEKSPQLLSSSTVAMYYYCYRAITEEVNEQWFPLFRQAIETQSSKFEPAEKRDIILLAINYCIRKMNTGNESFIREAFEIYRLSITEGFLLEDRIIPESAFTNIVSLAAKLKEYQWAEDFLENNKKYLKKIYQEPLYYYSLGRLYYEKKQYDDSMVNLAKVDTKISFLLLATKSLQIKIYYELEETEALDNLLESFRVYLQRRKDLGYRKENFENLIAFVRRLVSIPYKSKKEKEALIEEVKAATVFSEKEWLLRQLNTTKI